jgi:hypothetical protein
LDGCFVSYSIRCIQPGLALANKVCSVTCFAIMAQVFVVVAAGSVIGFIIRDIGDAPIAGWIIQVCYSELPTIFQTDKERDRY